MISLRPLVPGFYKQQSLRRLLAREKRSRTPYSLLELLRIGVNVDNRPISQTGRVVPGGPDAGEVLHARLRLRNLKVRDGSVINHRSAPGLPPDGRNKWNAHVDRSVES